VRGDPQQEGLAEDGAGSGGPSGVVRQRGDTLDAGCPRALRCQVVVRLARLPQRVGTRILQDRASSVTLGGSVDRGRVTTAGKDWDANDEFVLKRSLVLRSRGLLPSHPYLIDDEWDVVAGKTNEGRGDLMFTNGEGGFAVVEVKFIDNGRSGPTARAKRTDSRSKVREQALKYAYVVAANTPGCGEVVAYAYTNERPNQLDEVGRVPEGWGG